MPSSFVDVCRFLPTAGGTADWTFSTAVLGYQSPTLAGAVNGAIYSVRAESTDLTQWELSIGAYNSGTGVFSRTTVLYNSSGTGTGAGQSGAGTKINFSTIPQVGLVDLAEDLLLFNAAMSLTAAQQIQALANLGASSSFGCGQLTFTGTTALAFLPYNGAGIRIGGVIFQIPPATGIAGLGSPTSVFLNGVAAQTLAINTTYYIYAFSNSGTVTADFSTTGHVASSTAGNVGTEIKNGDNSRTIIGMVRTGGTVIYASDLQTISWFNRRLKFAEQTQSLAAAGNSTAINFMSWADEAVVIGTVGFISNTGTNITVWQDRIDTVNVGVTSQGTISSANAQMTFNSSKPRLVSEGNHAYDAALSATGGTPSAGGTSTVQIRG